MSAGRTICAMAVLGVCLLHGKVAAARAFGRMTEAQGLLEDIVSVDRMIRLERLELTEIGARLAQTGRCRQLWKQVDENTARGMNFRQALTAARLPDVGKEAEAALMELARDFGSNDMEAEGTRLSSVIERMENALRDLKENDGEKARLSMKLSALAGAAAAILII